MEFKNHLVQIPDTKLFVSERGKGYPLIVLHGGPGLDHQAFGGYLDKLSDNLRLILIDQRSQGQSENAPKKTWTLKQMAKDVLSLAESLDLEEYAVLGHSYGAFVALQNAVDFPGRAAISIISSGIPSLKYLKHVDKELENFEPEELRGQVAESWAKETEVETSQEVADLLAQQLPFHFKDPFDSRINEFVARTANAKYSAEVLSHFAKQGYGGIEVEDQLNQITQPTLVLGGRFDRTCTPVASKVIADGIPNSELVIFENSGHLTMVEENEAYLQVVTDFISKHS